MAFLREREREGERERERERETWNHLMNDNNKLYEGCNGNTKLSRGIM